MNHAGCSFHNFRRIKTIGVDEFDIRTLGLLHLFLNRFKGATAIAPIGADSAHRSMQGAMTAYQRSEHFWMRFWVDFTLEVIQKIMCGLEYRWQEWHFVIEKVGERFNASELPYGISSMWSNEKWRMGEKKLYPGV
ncbi:uncharacterized protein RCO7_01383 [Rhynchosporium graminicola]|uniref:Uncharacterized protein n=1 Tax=Rhynchosporium graminicola TaxID=2792576 RepID=A0A1E1JZ62_9HELO|nr:uncharacterized protein RCO7_01383 [Rhynchosporium commune]